MPAPWRSAATPRHPRTGGQEAAHTLRDVNARHVEGTHTHTHTHADTHTRTHMHTHAHIHTQTHTHTRAHTHT